MKVKTRLNEIYNKGNWAISFYVNTITGTINYRIENTKTGFMNETFKCFDGKLHYDNPELIPKTVKRALEKYVSSKESEG
ncbi:MAG TPA: hypothetical protein ENH82_14045 [bacterium]|nr:hypothetical protein [bacterium]